MEAFFLEEGCESTCVQDDGFDDSFDKKDDGISEKKGARSNGQWCCYYKQRLIFRLGQPISVQDEAENEQGTATDQTEAMAP